MRNWFICTISFALLLQLGCGGDNGSGESSTNVESPLAKVLNQWTAEGGKLSKMLESVGAETVKSKADAAALCAALEILHKEPSRVDSEAVTSPLHLLTAFFQQIESEEAFELLKQDGLPRLRPWVHDLLAGKEVNEGDLMLVLKILARYRQKADAELVAQVARKSFNPEGYLWSIILGQFDAEHPYSLTVVEALRDPLPAGFILVSYLDMSNQLAIADRLERHPFNTPMGMRQLQAWLSDQNKDRFSYAHSATAALPFVDSPHREQLLQVARQHKDVGVRMEAAWAQAKSGDSTGLDRLVDYCRDPRYSSIAQQYLQELGQPSKIPVEAQRTDFKAVSEMAGWLAHPQEFARAPDTISLLDKRELFWPPTNDKRTVFLIRYTYDGNGDSKPVQGVGMVGSITFALMDESMDRQTAEDIYALHCCWELQALKDPRAPKERTISAGRELLSEKNEGF